MLSAAADQDPRTTTALKRAIGFLAFWLILSGFSLGDLPAGILAAGCASWASLRFLPPSQHKRHPVRIAQLMLRFLQQSVVAGLDVAWRALDPRLPLAPGVAICRCASPTGPLRSGFCTMASLQPGLLPAGFDADGNLVVHCLDVGQPVVRLLAEEEQRFLRALGLEQHHA
jgi:multicomponent Na+:H+ antiporter subunit E